MRSAWDEAKHPRGHDGEFAKTPGGGSEYRGKPLTAGQQVGGGMVMSADRDREHLVLADLTSGEFSSHIYSPDHGEAPVPGIAKAAVRLNSGGTLDGSDTGRALKAGIGEWTAAGNAPGEGHPRAAEAFRQAVRAAPANAPALWRGMNEAGAGMKNADKEFTALLGARPGFRFHTGMASWTAAEDVAALFSRTSGGGTGGKVMLQLRPGASALRIDQHAGGLAAQQEWVSRGDFEVAARTVQPDGTILLEVVQR